LLTNATNPKSLAFWSSVAVVSIDPNSSLLVRIASVALVAVMGLAWHVGVAILFSTAPAQRAYLRVKPVLSAITSIIMAAFGVRLLASLVAARS
jgi:threonine efflux protein